MKYFSIFRPTSTELVGQFAEKRNLVEYVKENYSYPKEDYLMTSDEPPIFVVSDGVTLNFVKLVEDKIPYPNPSPAGDVAKIFCEAVIKSTKEKYDKFNEADIKDVFKEANNVVAEYNKRIGKSDISGNITGYYSATGAFVVIKDKKAYFASICDSFVAHFDKDMNLKFITSGSCSPYSVINGEEKMAQFLEKGVLDVVDGDRIFVFTDGFEHCVRNSEFLKFFINWDETLNNKIEKFSQEMNIADPEKYGHERSLVAVLI